MVETELHLDALGSGLCFAANFLVRRFKGAQAADFVHDAFRVQFVLQPLQCAVDWLSFTNNYFWHENLSFP